MELYEGDLEFVGCDSEGRLLGVNLLVEGNGVVLVVRTGRGDWEFDVELWVVSNCG